MDADSSYGGSDTAQDNSSFMDSTTATATTPPHDNDVSTAVHNMPAPQEEPNAFYHKNEITLPVNYDETDFQDDKSTNRQPHYLSTANLNINETLENHSNLEEMSKNYKSTSQLNVMDSPKSRRKSDVGIDNPAFNHKGDEVKSTFDNSRPYSGDLSSANVLGLTSPTKNDEPLTEAVNLELINLKPGNGKDVTGPYENGSNGTTAIPVKKEADAEMGNPYDEYFVPVNEHRKYMRGEKLYVTMDKRNKKKRNKCLCWGICLCIVAAAVIIGILAAVGVIGNQGAHPVQEVSARNFDGSGTNAAKDSDNVKTAGGIFGLPPDLANEEKTRSSTPGLPVSTVSSSLPSTETSMIEVPRALESEIVIDNLEFSEALKDKNSTEYKELAKSLEDQIKNSLFSFNELYNGAANIEVKVMDFESGSVVVKYRITWNFKEGLHNTKDPIDPEMVKRKMRSALDTSGNMGTYHVKQDGIKAQKILDLCQFENHQCEHLCSFDYDVADFVCSCPIGQYLAEDGKKCLDHPPLNEPDLEPHHHTEKPEPAAEPEPTTLPNEHEVNPEPTAEPVTEGTRYVQIHTYEESPPQPEPTSEPEPEPTDSPQEVSHENYVHFHPVDEVPVAEPTSEPSAEPTAEPAAEPTTQASSDSKSEDEHVPIVVVHHETTTEPTAEPTAEPAPEPTTMVPEIEHKETTIIPSAEPLPEPTAEPNSDKHEHDSVIVEGVTASTPEPSAEPTAEPSAEPTTTEHGLVVASSSTTTSTEPTAEPTVEPSAEPTAEPSAEPTAEPSAEPTTQKVTETSSETIVDHVTLLSVSEHSTEPSAEPTAEPTSDDSLKVEHEPTPGPSAEPTAEPSAEPTTLPSASSSSSPTEESVVVRHNNFNGEIFAEPENATEVLTASSSTTESSVMKEEISSTDITTSPKPENVSTSQEDDLHLIPVVINSDQTTVQTTQSNQPESITIAVVINDEAMTVHPENVTISNGTSSVEPKIYEVTTQHSEMTKIFSELHKVIDSSTEIVMPLTTNRTHSEVSAAESNESTSAMDNMSPFLPELDNDTFVNKLHLGEHYMDHTQRESHDDEIYVTPAAPRLDDDEMNTTNPYDLNPKDASLRVIPLAGSENETNVITNSTSIDETFTENMTDSITTTPKVILEENTTSTEKEPESVIPVVVVSTNNETADKESENVTTTLPPPPLSEIINNVHSNSFFEKMHENVDRNETVENVTSTQNISSPASQDESSTEDLLAMETTTSGTKLPEPENRGVVGIRAKEVIPTTIHAEIVDTVTDTVLFNTNNETSTSSAIMIIPPEKTANETKLSETMNITTENVVKAAQENTSSRQYEVKETVADVTTTERLFLATKSTSESPKNLTNDLLHNINYDDLAVVPLNSEDENQLESVSDEKTNDITEEERSVLDKFHHGFNEIHDNVGTTTTKNDEINTELDKSEYKKDKKAYDKKLGKATMTDQEMMSTSLPSDKDQHPFSDIRPVTEGYSILPTFSRCLPQQFHCVNGTSMKDGSYCISQNDRCDSVDDCTDGSDEIDCEKEGCPNNFQCASGQCLKRHLVCDGIQNCNDGSDELSCENWICKLDEISCGEGRRCIPKAWKCDGKKQCPDGIDEHGCPSMECGNDTFQCHEQGTCIPNTWRCDGKTDCVNSEDERSCVCSSSEYKCAIGGGCVNLDQRCDGSSDCADGSDEWNCLRLQEDDIRKYLQVGSGNDTWLPVCSDNWNQTYSDLICQEMGYSGSSLTETVAKPEGNFTKFYKIKSNPQSGSPVLSQLEKTESCDFLNAVTCQEFSCGVHSSSDAQSARIIGGNIAADTQWPSLTLLYNKKKNLQCTATLLAPLWAVASHSCVFYSQENQPSDWILYAGSSNFFGNSDNSTTQTRNIKKIVSHPQAKFSHFEFINDLVLMELSSPLTLTRNVSAVCLPEKDIQPRQLCIIAGWGVRKPGEMNQTQYLHYLPVPIIDTQECNSTKHYNGMINEDKICAGFTDSEKTPCYNDEGAPLMCFSDGAGIWELHGVLSYHDNCGKGKHPAIYTSLNTKIRQWVVNTIGQNPMRSA